MNRYSTALASLVTGIALIVIAGLSACSGAVGGSPPVVDPTRITILPAGTALTPVTAYSGLPTTFTLAGGTGSYIVSSDNQAVIAISGAVNSSSFTVIPSPVLTNTTVTITVRDTGTAPTASTTITVKPGTVNNSITVTPTSSDGAACSPAICSGSDALVSVTIAQGGIPLAARGVRFDVLSGSFNFVQTDPVTHATTLVNTIQVVTDETGNAVARIRVQPSAPNQTALLQVTDIGTGTFQTHSFAIQQATGSTPGFSIIPSGVIFQGQLQNQCAGANSGIFADFTILGGTPPYNLSGGGSLFRVTPTVVTASGGDFNVTPNGSCAPAPGITIVATDAAGRTATATVQNLPGTQAPSALSVSPDNVTLTTCSGQASVNVAGGASNGAYFASTGSDALTATVTGGTVTIGRRNPSAATAGPLSVGVSDGSTTASITVNLSGEGAGACPALVATPSSVTLTNCTAGQDVNVTGGSGTYTAASDNASVSATPPSGPAPFTVHITRTAASGPFTPPAHVIVRNGTASVVIDVNATGAGAPGDGNGTCP
jgi:hypothetical protein